MTNTRRILGDLTVLELSPGIPGAYCGKLLAGLGARVIKVEPPEGEAGRFLAPFAGNSPHLERSAPFLYLNTAKESVTLDVAKTEGRALFRRLVSGVDVVVESYPPGTLAAVGSWGGWCLSLAPYVTGVGPTDAATAPPGGANVGYALHLLHAGFGQPPILCGWEEEVHSAFMLALCRLRPWVSS